MRIRLCSDVASIEHIKATSKLLILLSNEEYNNPCAHPFSESKQLISIIPVVSSKLFLNAPTQWIWLQDSAKESCEQIIPSWPCRRRVQFFQDHLSSGSILNSTSKLYRFSIDGALIAYSDRANSSSDTISSHYIKEKFELLILKNTDSIHIEKWRDSFRPRFCIVLGSKEKMPSYKNLLYLNESLDSLNFSINKKKLFLLEN